MPAGMGHPPHPWASYSSASLLLLFKKNKQTLLPYIRFKSPLFQFETRQFGGCPDEGHKDDQRAGAPPL